MAFSVSLVKKMVNAYETHFKIKKVHDKSIGYESIRHHGLVGVLLGVLALIGFYFSVSVMYYSNDFLSRLNLPIHQAAFNLSERASIYVFSVSIFLMAMSLFIYLLSAQNTNSGFQILRNEVRKVMFKRKLKNLSRDILTYHKEISDFFESQDKVVELRNILDVLSGKSVIQIDIGNVKFDNKKSKEVELFPSYDSFIQHKNNSENKNVEFFEKNSSKS